MKLQEFYLLRKKDLSGVSGTGVVARGIILESHRAILEWRSIGFETMSIFDNLEQIRTIHGHDGNTEIILGSPPKKLLDKRK